MNDYDAAHLDDGDPDEDSPKRYRPRLPLDYDPAVGRDNPFTLPPPEHLDDDPFADPDPTPATGGPGPWFTATLRGDCSRGCDGIVEDEEIRADGEGGWECRACVDYDESRAPEDSRAQRRARRERIRRHPGVDDR